jgi:type I restriction enzyme, S subunit
VTQGWKQGAVAEFCHVEYGTRVVRKRDQGSAYPVYGGGGATFAMDTFNREDRVVIARFGMSEWCTRFVAGKFFLNDSGLTLSPRNPEELLPQYLDLWALAMNDEIYSLGKGAAQKNLDAPAFRRLPVSHPIEVSAQRRIVHILHEALRDVAASKANAERNAANARALFDSHLQVLFSHHGEGWVQTSLGEEIDLLPGFAFKSPQYTEAEVGVRLLRGDNIVQGRLRWDNAKRWPASDVAAYERYRLCAGDVVLAMDRPWVTAGLKRARISDSDLPCLLVQRTARLRGNGRLDNGFLLYLISSPPFARHILGIQTGLGVPHISGQQIKDFRFWRPSMGEQLEIACKLDELVEDIQRLEAIFLRKREALLELTTSLLHHAVGGQLGTQAA